MNYIEQQHPLDYISRGNGPTVILIHGMGASRYDWEALVPELVSKGYRTYAVDLLGHGNSPKPDNPEQYTIQAMYEALVRWIEMQQPPAPFHLIGHSLGGYLSLMLSLQQAELVHSVSLIDPLYTLTQIHPVLRYFSKSPGLGVKLLPRVPHNLIDTLLGWDPVTSTQFSPQARLQTALDIKRASPHILNIPRSVQDLTPQLALVQQPCQVIWGDKDLTLSSDSFPPLVASLPQAKGHEIPGTGHQPHIGVPEIVNPMILEFIGQNNGHSQNTS